LVHHLDPTIVAAVIDVVDGNNADDAVNSTIAGQAPEERMSVTQVCAFAGGPTTAGVS
jgi:hypothetical protein